MGTKRERGEGSGGGGGGWVTLPSAICKGTGGRLAVLLLLTPAHHPINPHHPHTTPTPTQTQSHSSPAGVVRPPTQLGSDVAVLAAPSHSTGPSPINPSIHGFDTEGGRGRRIVLRFNFFVLIGVIHSALELIEMGWGGFVLYIFF